MKVSVAMYSYHGLLADGMIDVFGCLEAVRFHHDLPAIDIWNGGMPDHIWQLSISDLRFFDLNSHAAAQDCVGIP